MNLNFEELAKKEVERQVKDKINNKLHLVVQKELKNYQYQNMISSHCKIELSNLLNDEIILKYIDFEKLHKDIVSNVSEMIYNKLTNDMEYY